MVKMLIACKINVNLKDRSGTTALYRAASQGNENNFVLFKTENFQNSVTFVLSLARIDHKDVVQLLLKNGADVNVKNNEQWTPLHAASYFGYLDVVQLLLDRRADVNAKNNYGNGPIHLASDAGKLNFRTERNCFFQNIKYSLKFEFAGFDKVVEKLISHKADVNLTNNQGWNALIWAVFSS